jgi:hypothetical protein
MYGKQQTRKSHRVNVEERYGKRQPRPALRKQGTRKGAVLAARREAGV